MSLSWFFGLPETTHFKVVNLISVLAFLTDRRQWRKTGSFVHEHLAGSVHEIGVLKRFGQYVAKVYPMLADSWTSLVLGIKLWNVHCGGYYAHVFQVGNHCPWSKNIRTPFGLDLQFIFLVHAVQTCRRRPRMGLSWTEIEELSRMTQFQAPQIYQTKHHEWQYRNFITQHVYPPEISWREKLRAMIFPYSHETFLSIFLSLRIRMNPYNSSHFPDPKAGGRAGENQKGFIETIDKRIGPKYKKAFWGSLK